MQDHKCTIGWKTRLSSIGRIFQQYDMIKKKQMVLEAGDEGLTAAALFYSLAA